ncbi:MAG: hypothetical protein JWM80_3483 [Cyanobacteria bacterium RYN_339]|nr:hypothetical protein [Cyanobacteria bacterium RYN_339]
MAKPIITFDTDVLVAALLAPSSPSARVLQLASLGIYEASVAPAALAEAERLGRAGVAGRGATEAEVLAFRGAIAEILKDAPAGAVRCGATALPPERVLAALLEGADL